MRSGVRTSIIFVPKSHRAMLKSSCYDEHPLRRKNFFANFARSKKGYSLEWTELQSLII